MGAVEGWLNFGATHSFVHCSGSQLRRNQPGCRKLEFRSICICAGQAETTQLQQHSSSVDKDLITISRRGQSANNKSSWRPKHWTGESARVCVRQSPDLKQEVLNAQARKSESRTKLNFSEYGMGSRKYMLLNRWKRARKGLLQQGAVGNLQGILNQQDALVPSSPSIVVLCQPQVAIDSPRSLLGCGERAPCASSGQGR